MRDGNLLTVNIGRDEAFTLLREWATKRTLLRCNVSFDRVALCVRARIRELTAARVELLSDDTRNEVVLPLSADVDFGTGTFRDEAPDDAATYGRFLSVFMPDPSNSESPENVTLIEVKEDE